MERLDPSHLPPTELESMNRDHRDQVELVNAVLDAAAAFERSEAHLGTLDEAVDDFAEHTTEHFRQEEDQMLRFQFPAFALHAEEHARVLVALRAAVEGWKKERDVEALRAFVGQEFVRWLTHHIATMDLMCARFVAGQTP